MLTETRAITTQDIEYLRHGDTPLTMRLFRPEGAGPFPCIVDVHGGAWCRGDLNTCKDRDEALAEAGFAVAAIDFRHAGDGYPTSLIDINYAVRFVKAHAADLDIDPERVGLSGQSSGGHLAMLAAMRPDDARYASIALPDGGPAVDARVRCVGMSWPVINPLSRYAHAKRRLAEANPPKWADGIPECHDTYWVTEENMAEGNPMVALESGEKVETPPALWVQGQPDDVHDYRDLDTGADANEPERFAANYRKAGGEIDVVYIEQENRYSPTSFQPLAEFFAKHL